MPNYRIAALALSSLVGCAQLAPPQDESETDGSSASASASEITQRPERTRDAGVRPAPRPPVKPRPATPNANPSPAAPAAPPPAVPAPAPEPAPGPAAPLTGDDCKDKGLPPEDRFCGRSPGTELILYRCENNDWVEVSRCVTVCEVNGTFGKDQCK